MEVLKKHIGQILSSVIIAVIGVFCSVVPYFALAKITQNIACLLYTSPSPRDS